MTTLAAPINMAKTSRRNPPSQAARTAVSPSILDGWTDTETQKFQREIMTFQHKLEETGLFSDEALIDLLERHPSHMLDVCTMGATDDPLYPNRFRTGDFRNVPAAEILAAAKAGRIWVNVRQAMNVHEDYKAVLDKMYGGLAEATGNRVFNAKGGVLISSPVARVPYHFDKTEVVLWHVRGQKTVYVWPRTQKFIPDTAHESVLMHDRDDDLPYTEAFEADAIVLRLQPGQGASWPLNSPHRVDNETFCVSVTTEFSTTESGMKNATMVTNAALRRYLGMNPLYDQDGPVARRVKSLVGRVIRKTPLAVGSTDPDLVTFKIDPTVDGYLVDVEPFERTF